MPCHGGGRFVRGWTLSGLITLAANFAAVARSLALSVGPYIGRRRRRRRLKGMKEEGVVLPAQWGLLLSAAIGAACLPHICRGTVPNLEMGEAPLSKCETVTKP